MRTLKSTVLTRGSPAWGQKGQASPRGSERRLGSSREETALRHRQHPSRGALPTETPVAGEQGSGARPQTGDSMPALAPRGFKLKSWTLPQQQISRRWQGGDGKLGPPTALGGSESAGSPGNSCRRSTELSGGRACPRKGALDTRRVFHFRRKKVR